MVLTLASLAIAGSPFSLTCRPIGILGDREVTFRVASLDGKKDIEETSVDTRKGVAEIVLFQTPSGKYRVTVSGQGMLPITTNVDFSVKQTVDLGNLKPIIGDVNGDGKIDEWDVSEIKSYLGVRSGSHRWIFGDDVDRFCGANCDLNGDNVVDQADVRIARANLGLPKIAR
ncbi:MAG: hypothetical protein GC165_06705 [Armatimonadetes bacterium]|nr:hypothetical protein [Armatimonadota bacterium]